MPGPALDISANRAVARWAIRRSTKRVGAFLAYFLVQLTDDQLRKLFEVARVDRRSRDPHNDRALPGATVDEWVSAFKHKRDEIVTNRCPA